MSNSDDYQIPNKGGGKIEFKKPIVTLRNVWWLTFFTIRLAKIYSSINNINITNHGTVMTVSMKKRCFLTWCLMMAPI